MDNYGPDAPPFPIPVLPVLKHLTSLGITSMGDFSRQERHVLILSLLRTYGKQITRFKCDEALFGDGVGMDVISELLPNIKTLEIELLYQDDFELTWDQLARINWPLLECLILKAKLISWSDKGPTLHFSSGLMRALHNFRASLKELRLLIKCSATPEAFEFGILDNMTTLKISVDNYTNASRETWELFRAIFGNLKVMEWRWRYFMYDDDVGPQKSKLRVIFSPMFPQLKDVFWPRPRQPWEMLWMADNDGRISFSSEKKPVRVEPPAGQATGCQRVYVWAGEKWRGRME